MAHYEELGSITPAADCSYLHSGEMPILVRPEDPALSVMIDFQSIKPAIITADKSIEAAHNTMTVRDLHVLLVLDPKDHIKGLIGTQDIVGERPIQLMQERRLKREEILVNMLMTPVEQALFFKLENVQKARVGHIFTTLVKQRQPYAGVIDESNGQAVCGLFSTYQIRKRLHIEANSLNEAQSLAELQMRHR